MPLYWLFPLSNNMSETQEAPATAAAPRSSSDASTTPTSTSSSWKLPDGIENHIEAGNVLQKHADTVPIEIVSFIVSDISFLWVSYPFVWVNVRQD